MPRHTDLSLGTGSIAAIFLRFVRRAEPLRNPRLAVLLASAAVLACAGAAEAQQKVVRMAFRTAETGFDPQRVWDRYSIGVCENIFEGLLTYDYLARDPVRIVPLVAETVPAPEENGTRYTFRIRPGILFADDPVFKGRKREVVARDFEYMIKRFRDPKIRAPYSWLFENKIAGLDEFVEKAKKSGKYDYDAKIAGLEVRDRYTLSFKLKEPDYNFLYVLAMPNVVPMAREAVEAYDADTNAHPVGTGPFVLKEWVRRWKIVLERNPGHRGYELDTRFANPQDEWHRRAIDALADKRLPLIDRIEIFPIEQEQPGYLAFINHEHDLLDELHPSFVNQVLPNGKLAPALAKQDVHVFLELEPEITYDSFNVEDPVIGGYAPERVGLRRALVLAHDRGQEIDIIRKGQALPAQSPVPPGVVGYDADFHTAAMDYDPSKAKALLDMFGYVDRDGDGWRDQPDVAQLVLQYKYDAGGEEMRQLAELWSQTLANVGIRVETNAVQFADLLDAKRLGKFPMAGSAWTADYPDAQNFLQLFFGPNTDQSNQTRFKLPEYDPLHRKSLAVPDGPEAK